MIRPTTPRRDKGGAGGSDSEQAMQGQGRAGNITGGGGGTDSARGENVDAESTTGETGSILFPALSPGSPLGGGAIDGELGRPTVNSGRKPNGSFERGESGSSSRAGGTEAFAREATDGVEDDRDEVQCFCPGDDEQEGYKDSTPQSRTSEATGVDKNVQPGKSVTAAAAASSRPLCQPATLEETSATTPPTTAVGAFTDSEERRLGGMATKRAQENIGSACTRSSSGKDLEDFAGKTARLGESLPYGRKSNRRRQHGSSDWKRTASVGRTGVSGSSSYHNGGSPAKVDTEWENEIAKNILSLYQTKLKAELDEKRGAREEELGVSQLCVISVQRYTCRGNENYVPR